MVASQRTAVRPNSPVAAWPDERHDLAPAAAGGALVVRAWDRTTAWESVGSVARLDLGVGAGGGGTGEGSGGGLGVRVWGGLGRLGPAFGSRQWAGAG